MHFFCFSKTSKLFLLFVNAGAIPAGIFKKSVLCSILFPVLCSKFSMGVKMGVQQTLCVKMYISVTIEFIYNWYWSIPIQKMTRIVLQNPLNKFKTGKLYQRYRNLQFSCLENRGFKWVLHSEVWGLQLLSEEHCNFNIEFKYK